MSEANAEAQAAFVKAWSECTGFAHDREAQAGGGRVYSYMTLDRLLETLRPILSKNGFAVVQSVEPGGCGDSCDRPVAVTTRLFHSSGGSLTFGPIVMQPVPRKAGAKPTPQDYGSAITYARRYALAAVFGISAESDDDGERASGDAGQQRQPPPPATPKVAFLNASKDWLGTKDNNDAAQLCRAVLEIIDQDSTDAGYVAGLGFINKHRNRDALAVIREHNNGGEE